MATRRLPIKSHPSGKRGEFGSKHHLLAPSRVSERTMGRTSNLLAVGVIGLAILAMLAAVPRIASAGIDATRPLDATTDGLNDTVAVVTGMLGPVVTILLMTGIGVAVIATMNRALSGASGSRPKRRSRKS